MFARFRNLFARAKTDAEIDEAAKSDGIPSIVVTDGDSPLAYGGEQLTPSEKRQNIPNMEVGGISENSESSENCTKEPEVISVKGNEEEVITDSEKSENSEESKTSEESKNCEESKSDEKSENSEEPKNSEQSENCGVSENSEKSENVENLKTDENILLNEKQNGVIVVDNSETPETPQIPMKCGDESQINHSENVESEKAKHDEGKEVKHVHFSPSTDSTESLAAKSSAEEIPQTLENSTPNPSDTPETNPPNESSLNDCSVIVDDLAATDTAASPSGDSGHSSNTSSSNDAFLANGTSGGAGSSQHDTNDSSQTTQAPSTIVVQPTGGNAIACSAISAKLKEIAEVAESLDSVIRDVQVSEDCIDARELNGGDETSPNGDEEKKADGIGRSNSSDDWHSRSTEDDSFVTASEGNFTPHSHTSSSLFQTASGHTSSLISSGKNSFDASEADDSTFAFELPELNSPISMSFDGSERSFIMGMPQLQQQQQTKPTIDQQQSVDAEETNSVAGVEELHSESVTPTPCDDDHYHLHHIGGCLEGPAPVAIESENELESYIADAPTVETLTISPLERGVTPEVSSNIVHQQLQQQQHSASCCSQSCGNEPLTPSRIPMPVTTNKPPLDKQQQAESAASSQTAIQHTAWRRSKYYENITKQTIKGFL